MPFKFKADIRSQGDNVGKKKKPSIKTSVFGITLNPNISTIPGAKKHKEVHDNLLEIASLLFGSEEGLKDVIGFRTSEHEWNDKYIIELKENNHTVEYDEKHHKLHLQGLIHIRHRSNIYININLLKNITANILNIDKESIHCTIKTNYNEKKAADYPFKDTDA